MFILLFILLLILLFIKIITRHNGFFSFLRTLIIAYKESCRSFYLFFKLEVIPYFTGKTVKNKPYDYSLWIRWKWKFFDRIQFLVRNIFYLWLILMFFNIYQNGALFDIYNILTENWFPFFLFLCKLRIIFLTPNFIYSFNSNFYEFMNLFF